MCRCFSPLGPPLPMPLPLTHSVFSDTKGTVDSGDMVGVAQLVRALGCGPRGQGFESLHSPQHESYRNWRRH